MADQKNRGGQKRGLADEEPERKLGADTQGAGERSDQDKRRDQQNNPDDEARQPTDQQR
ncbi:MAG: hypothetical protein K2W96_03680 [Gemmataceae bacterium]|nr:hypothetical protein [Gemmataceae bacterium]